MSNFPKHTWACVFDGSLLYEITTKEYYSDEGKRTVVSTTTAVQEQDVARIISLAVCI